MFAKHRPDAVLHFAALTDAGESVSRPDVYYRNNLVGTWTAHLFHNDLELSTLTFEVTP